MAKLIRDGRKNAIQALMLVAGGRVDRSVTAATPVVFQPTLGGIVRIYEISTTATVTIVGHNSAYTWVPTDNPPLEPGIAILIELDGNKRDRITMQAVAGDATVTICECDDD